MSAPVAEGDVILEKYRVERVLGKGGMGVVVAATHVELEQRVALKFLLPLALEHPEIVERFAREARAAAKIQSQHVARVIDTGRMPSGEPFMVMEYLEGLDLADVLEKEGSLTPAVAVDYVLQACEAIAEAHAAGIVHRDLKPSNLFLAKQRDRRAIIKVLDFGISKLDDPREAPLTRTSTTMGSPQYMSPEQLTSSKDVDARTDIWSLGVILYELVAGRRPFDAPTMPEAVALILRNTPDRLSMFRPEVVLDFEHVVSRCLATFPQDRYASVAELAAALRPFAQDASSAQAAVGRITRVLGGASLPPPGASRAPGASASRVSVADTRLASGADTTTVPTAKLPNAAVIVNVAPPTPADVRTGAAVSIEATHAGGARSPIAVYVAVGGALLLGGVVFGMGYSRGAASKEPSDSNAVTHGLVASAAPILPPPSAMSALPEPTAPASSAAPTPSTVTAPVPSASARAAAAPRAHSSAAPTPKAVPSAVAPPASQPKKNPLDMGIK